MRHTLISIMRGLFLMVVASGCGLSGGGNDLDCAEVATDFEFRDVSGEFAISGDDSLVIFENGLSQTVGIPSFYGSGSFAWMVPAGEVGTIRIDPPAEQIRLLFRDQSSATDGVLTVFDSAGAVIEEFVGSTMFVEIEVSVEVLSQEGIATITLESLGPTGFSIIDDFSACFAEGDGEPDDEPISDPIPAAIPLGEVTIGLETVAAGLVAPNWGATGPDDSDRLFVVDQPGQLWAVSVDTGEQDLFLDLSDRLVELGAFGPESFDERGFLGVAFHPDYLSNGFLYTYTSEPANGDADFSTMPAGTEPNHQSVVTEWRVPDPADSDSVPLPASARELIRVDQPQFNHNGGALNFGPDGMLYVAFGDGGGADDGQPPVGHSSQGNGQDATNPLGSVLRIDPLGSTSANGQYGIPADNPFVGPNGSGDTVEEIFAYGFRNPFRFSFDTTTGELYLADVGQNDVEEINIVQSGGNYGWSLKEGSFFFNPNEDQDGFVTAGDPGTPENLVDPVAQYDHDEGLAILGGFVYRGQNIPALQGRYVFGDFARTFSNDGRLFYLDSNDEIVELLIDDGSPLNLSLLGFGQDASGEIYVLGNSTGTPFGDTGVVLRMTAAN